MTGPGTGRTGGRGAGARADGRSAEQAAEQARSLAELEAGRLPLSAQARLARHGPDTAFTSDLRAGELAALRAAGWAPVGQVFGTAVVSTAGRYYSHPGSGRWTSAGAVPAGVREAPRWFDPERAARQSAARRLLAEVRGLRADGALGLRQLPVTAPDLGGVACEVSFVATAVRRPGRPGPGAGTPFLTALSATDLVALGRAGYAPVATVFDLSRHVACGAAGRAAYLAASSRLARGADAREMADLTALVAGARRAARHRLEVAQRQWPGSSLLLHAFDVVDGAAACPLGGGEDAVADVVAGATVVVPTPPLPPAATTAVVTL